MRGELMKMHKIFKILKGIRFLGWSIILRSGTRTRKKKFRETSYFYKNSVRFNRLKHRLIFLRIAIEKKAFKNNMFTLNMTQ